MAICARTIKEGINAKDTDVVCLAVVDSTNNEAKRWIEGGFKGSALIAAERQTAGRGRQGKSFFSGCPEGIYMTAVLPITPKDPAAVTIAAAVAAAKAAEEAAGVYPRLKWVNDIFWGGKKAGGILCEAKDGFIIVGIGINCEASEKAFPHELRGIAGGLPLNGAARERIISEIYNNLRYYLDADFSKTIEEYRARSTMGGKTVRFLRNGEFITAFVKGIGDDGALIVETGDGETERLTSGEVVIVENLYG